MEIIELIRLTEGEAMSVAVSSLYIENIPCENNIFIRSELEELI